MTDIKVHPASYKDPAGFVFEHEGCVYRHLDESYTDNYELLMRSGLYASLFEKELLIGHTEISENISGVSGFYKTLLPYQLPFISYPYEWSFDMLKDAALLTLQVCREAISYGMILKDATAYNIQFINSRPVFIDTLSFEAYDPSEPWVAYRQFCEMFLSPLLLSHYTGVELNKLLLAYPEGVPVHVCSGLLPFRTRFNLISLLHIHLQATVKTDAKAKAHAHGFSRQKLLNILQHLSKGIAAFSTRTAKSTWSDYYSSTIKSAEYLKEKQVVFSRLLEQVSAVETAIDIGANNGFFSKMMAEKNWQIVASDFDSNAVNDLYNDIKKNGKRILPLVIDISFPSPSIGWQNRERNAFLERGAYELVVALALVHHLAIGKNVSLPQVAACMAGLCKRYLIIEYIEKEDEKAQLLLQRKRIPYDQYTKAAFEKEFSVHFELLTSLPISNGLRTMYLWKRKEHEEAERP